MRTLRHVLWIGGPPGSGKTTVATRLARRHGLRWYNADTRTWEHRDRAVAAGHEAAIRWESMDPPDRWVTPAPDELFAMSLHRERGTMVVDDLRRLPASPLVVAEGSTLSPDVLSSGIAEPSRALWLIPTEEYSRPRHDERRWPPGVRALHALVAADIERQAREHGAATIAVDGSLGIEETVATVEELFAEALAAGPLAGSSAERRALLRQANEAIVSQVRGYYARPWAHGDADGVVRTFLCECGATGCDADLEVTVGAAACGPVVAAGHSGRT